MKKSENNFAITGFIATEPEIRQLTNSQVARFALSISAPAKSDDTKKVSALTNIEAFSKNIDLAGLHKGMLVTVKGFFRPEEWSKDGKNFNRIAWVATSITPPEEKPE